MSLEVAVRRSLEKLKQEFERAADRYRPLYHEQLIHPVFLPEHPLAAKDESPEEAEQLSTKEWKAFIAAHTPSPDGKWQEWHGPIFDESYEWLGRFFGDPEGLHEFKQLAESLFLVLRKIDSSAKGEGFEGCLSKLHEIAANWPTTLLRSSERYWGLAVDFDDSDLSIEESNQIVEAVGEHQGVQFFAHPIVESLHGSVFVAAAHFIEMIVDDDSTLFLSDMHFGEPNYPTLSVAKKSKKKEPADGDTPSSVSDGSSLFHFDDERKQWHLVFRYGLTADEVEEAWLDDGASVRYVAFAFDHPDSAIPFANVLPERVTNALTAARGSFITQSESLDADGHMPSAAKANQGDTGELRAGYKKALSELQREIEEADDVGDTEDATRLRLKWDGLMKSYDQSFDKYGRERIHVSQDESRHRKRVGNGLDRFKKMLTQLPAGERLIRFKAELSRIIYRGRRCLEYHRGSNVTWSVRWPQSKS